MVTGHIYLITTEKGDKVKIGMTTDADPSIRLASIQTGSPYKLYIYHSIICDDVPPRRVESDLHKIFGAYRLHGEWFDVSGALAFFMSEAKDGMHAKASRHGASGERWVFIRSDGAPQDYMAMGAKSAGDQPYSTALYMHKKTKDPLATENAALRVILSNLVRSNANMGAAINVLKRSLQVIEEIESDSCPNYRINDGLELAHRLVRESDENRCALEYAHLMLNESDDFFGNALYHCDKPSGDR